MLDWLFGKSALPEGYVIRSTVQDGDTYYALIVSGKVIAMEYTIVSSHKACIRRLRKAARVYAKNGVVPR